MDTIVDFLISNGYTGMFLSAFLAGTVVPFSSEAVILALLAGGLDPLRLTIYGTVGNVAGSMLNYFIGRMGRMDWIERYLHVSKKQLDRAHKFLSGRGAWMAFFAFVPFIGNAITVALGLMRGNILITLVSMTIGKIVRYALLLYGVSLFS